MLILECDKQEAYSQNRANLFIFNKNNVLFNLTEFKNSFPSIMCRFLATPLFIFK